MTPFLKEVSPIVTIIITIILYKGDKGMAMPLFRKKPLIASIISQIETRLKKQDADLLRIIGVFALLSEERFLKIFF